VPVEPWLRWMLSRTRQKLRRWRRPAREARIRSATAAKAALGWPRGRNVWTTPRRDNTSKMASGAEPEQEYLYPGDGHSGNHFFAGESGGFILHLGGRYGNAEMRPERRLSGRNRRNDRLALGTRNRGFPRQRPNTGARPIFLIELRSLLPSHQMRKRF
jgi:hypothetical protein